MGVICQGGWVWGHASQVILAKGWSVLIFSENTMHNNNYVVSTTDACPVFFLRRKHYST